MVKYTLYTEDKGNIGRLTSGLFENFTLLSGSGFSQGKHEKSVAIIIISKGIDDTIQRLATLIKLENRQSEVLVTKEEVSLI